MRHAWRRGRVFAAESDKWDFAAGVCTAEPDVPYECPLCAFMKVRLTVWWSMRLRCARGEHACCRGNTGAPTGRGREGQGWIGLLFFERHAARAP